MSRVDRSRLPVPGPDRRFSFPQATKTTLANGLRVWTVEHRSVPVVSFLLIVPSGAAADPSARPGLAAITADMLDEGSGERSALEVQDALARIGAELETEVSADVTSLGLTTLTRFKERALALLADIVFRPRMDAREFARVRDLRLNRLLQLRDLAPAVADRAFVHMLYRGHPYGHQSIGTEAALRETSLDDLVAFHSRAYLPDQAVLIAVGDASHGDLAAEVDDAFGPWQAAGPGAVTWSQTVDGPLPSPEAALAVVDRPGSSQSELRIGQVGAARNTPDYHALLVLNMILGGQFVSRLNMNLRQDKGYTYGARMLFDFRRAPGPFVLQVSVQTQVTAAAIAESFGELEAIRGERPVTVEELEIAKAALTRGYARNFETGEQIARAVAQLAIYDLPDDDFETFVPSVASVGSDSVTRVAAAYLDPARMLTVVVGDHHQIGESLAGLGRGTPALVTVP